jgi:hypothetical protein
MNSDMRPPSGGRRPPTIDLKAIEVTPITDAAAAAPSAESGDAPPTAPADAGETGAPPHSAEPSAAAQETAQEPLPESHEAQESPQEPLQESLDEWPVADESPVANGSRAAEEPSVAASANEAAAASGAPPHQPAAAPRRGPSWLSLFGAGITGGVVVAAAAAALAVAGLLPGGETDTSALSARLAGVEQHLRDIAAVPLPAGADASEALEDLRGRLAKLEAAAAAPGRAAPGPATDPAFANRLSAIEGGVKALDESVGILGRRSDEAIATAREARQRADATSAGLAELTQKVVRPGAPPIERGELDALASRVTAVERGEKAVEAELAKRPAANDRSVRLALAAGALNGAVERGDSFASELATVKSLAADAKALATLEPFASAGVPTTMALSRELSELAPSLLQAAGVAPREGGFLERLQVNAEKLVRIRPTEEVAGSDPAAIIARSEAKASRADLAGAIAELAKLPAAARAPAEPWIKKAEARTAAIETSRRLATDALAGLGK